MSLKTLLKLQLIYALAGVMYNLVSLIVVYSGGQQLSTTSPLTGAAVMSVYGLFLLAARFDYLKIYRLLMAFSILFFGYGGIVIHLIKYSRQPDLYASLPAWILAVGINVFGLILNIYGATGLFEKHKDKLPS